MIDWLVDTTLAVTTLMLLVLAVRRPVAHFFGAGWAYALWLLPALRLVLPPLHLFGDGFPTLLTAEAAEPIAAAVATAPIEAAAVFQWEPVLLGVWLAGAALVVLWQSCVYLAFIRRLGIGSHVHASLAREIGIIESAEVEGPLAIGLLDRWIVVPADFKARYTAQEQRLALQHERVHHQREDILWNMVALGVLALNWFNPIAYLAFRAFRADQELSCDAAVAAQAPRSELHDYALALVKSASRPGLIAACPLNHAGQLKRRLKMMKAHRRSRMRALGGSSAVATLLLTGISLTESASVAASEAGLVAALPARAAIVAPAEKPDPAPSSAPIVELKFVSIPAKSDAKAAPAASVAKAAAPAAVAPSPVTAAVEPEAVAPTPPSPIPRVFMVRLDRPAQPVLVGPDLPARELDLIRTRVLAMPTLDPRIKAQLEKILADRAEEPNQLPHITLTDK